ncbi:ABC transporter permease [Myxococcaceae bacterium JPH2]|nr:ABC transporter permease [Myxococcaceae bacterium JPH2]
MIRPLIAKELRDQRPFLWLSLFFLAVEVITSLWTEPLGFSPYAETFVERFKVGGDLSTMTFVLAFALGTGLLVREQDDRTLEFLDALPTSRGMLFTVKLGVALGLVLLYPLGLTAWTLVEHGLSRTSLDAGLHVDLLLVGSVLRIIQALAVLSLALALAPLRRLSWTALAVLMMALSLWQDRVPWLAALNPLQLTSPEFEGTRWPWPLEAMAVQLGGSGVLLFIALAQFLGLGQRRLGALLRWLQNSWMSGVVTLATLGLFIAVLARLLGPNAGGAEGGAAPDESPRVRFPVSAVAQAATRYYRFTYPAELRTRAGPLLDAADGVHEQVRQFLGEEPGALIHADLGGSAVHTGGTAYWNTLRMDLAGASDAERARAVLGHETTHVLAHRLVGVASVPKLSRMKLLSEGLATYVETRFFSPSRTSDYQLIAAAARARREVKVEELLEPERLAADRDADWVYPLGRAFVDALVRRYGDGAPARVLAAIGRKDAPEGLDGALAWQDAFQTAGIDLSQVFDDMFAGLDAQVTEQRAFLESLPRPRGVVERQDGRVAVRARLDKSLPSGWRVVCRFRRTERAESYELDGPYAGEGPHWREATDVSEGRIWYQLGIQGPESLILYEPWTLVRVK